MKMKLSLFVLILSLTVNIAVVTTVGYHYYRNVCLTPSVPCPLNQGTHHFYESLGLSDAQLGKMEPLSRSFHARLAALKSQAEEKRELLIRLLGEEAIDRGRVENTRKEIAALQDAIQQEVVSHIIRTGEILNPEQKKRFFEMLRAGVTYDRLNPAFPITGGNK